MRANCIREDLLAAFQMVSGVIPARSPKPVLRNVKMIASPHEVALIATDLEVGIRHNVSGVTVEEPGELILPAVQFSAILRETTEEVLTIESEDNNTRIWGQRCEFQLPSEPPEEYPEVPLFEESAYHLVDAKLLRTMVRRTVFATDVESTRYALNGVLVDLDSDGISLVATDGRRLAYMHGKAKAVGKKTKQDTAPIIPTKAMNLIERNLHGLDEEVSLALLANKAMLKTSRSVISSRLVEGRFPPYRDVMPKGFEASVTVDTKEFLHAVRQAAITTSEESRGIDLTLDEGHIVLLARAAEVGQSKVSLPVAFEGRPMTVTFDPRYLLDMLRVIDDQPSVRLDLLGPEAAAAFRTDDGYVYVVMPLTRER